MKRLPGTAYPEHYETLLNEKISHYSDLLANYFTPQPELFRSIEQHFRMRAEFRIWHEDDQSFYAMHEPEPPHKKIFMEQYSIGSETINKLMPELMKEILKSQVLRERLFSVEFLTNKTGDAITTLLYHKRLDDTWQDQAELLAKKLNINILGRSKKQKISIGNDYIYEEFTVNSKTICYQQIENSFTQPNAFINQKMIDWVYQNTQELQGDALELYCGNGNFTFALAENFDHVLATELSKTSTRAALHNIEINNYQNIKLVRLSSEEVTQAINKEREFRRLKDVDLDTYNFSTVFVDPPRAGLDDKTLELVSQFDNICYISCNPETLKENLEYLQKTHHAINSAFFDQFPYTDHLECGVLLSKK